MERTLLAVDLSYQSYRASAAHAELSSAGVFTGGLYGVMTSLAKLIRETRATDLVVCQDRKPYRRSIEYPEYKTLRREKADDKLLELHKQTMALLPGLFDAVGVPVLGVRGFESDDCIAALARDYRGRFKTIYAASNDSDLFQLFRYPNFRVVKKDAESIIGPEYLDKLGITPDEFILASALQGTHNDIAGIPRVGEKTALKALRDPQLMRTLKDGWQAVIDRNSRLIRLPHPELPRLRLPPRGHFERFDQRVLYRFAARYDIEVTRSMIDSFQQVNP